MFRMSLRELFVLVAATAVAIVSLMYASPLWQAIFSLVAMLLALRAVIASLVDRGPRRAFAIGFAVAMLGYVLIVINVQKFMPGRAGENTEFDVYAEGRLPTSIALQNFYAGISRTKYFDAKTGARIPESERENLMLVGENLFGIGGTGGGGGFEGGGMFGGASVQVPPGKRAALYEIRPRRENFMAIGHFWWALLFGYIGGRFGRVVYLRSNDLPRERN
jgi:hypothetical protein